MNLTDLPRHTLPSPLAVPEAIALLATVPTNATAVRWAHRKATAPRRDVSGAHLQSPESPGAFILAGALLKS